MVSTRNKIKVDDGQFILELCCLRATVSGFCHVKLGNASRTRSRCAWCGFVASGCQVVCMQMCALCCTLQPDSCHGASPTPSLTFQPQYREPESCMLQILISNVCLSLIVPWQYIESVRQCVFVCCTLCTPNQGLHDQSINQSIYYDQSIDSSSLRETPV